MKIDFSDGPIMTSLGTEIRIPIRVDTHGKKLGALRLRFDWDPDALAFVRESPGMVGGWKAIANRENVAAGAIIIGGWSMHGIAGKMTVHTLAFRALAPLTNAAMGVQLQEAFTEMAEQIATEIAPLHITATDAA